MSDWEPKALLATREGVVDGHYAVTTVNHALKDYAGKAWYAWHLKITILLDDDFPNRAEAESLDQFEDELFSVVRSVSDLQYVGRTTTRGLREVHLYVDEHEAAHEALTAAIERGTPKEVEHALAYDATWSQVDHFFNPA